LLINLKLENIASTIVRSSLVVETIIASPRVNHNCVIIRLAISIVVGFSTLTVVIIAGSGAGISVFVVTKSPLGENAACLQQQFQVTWLGTWNLESLTLS
jgi:hypothetical protein